MTEQTDHTQFNFRKQFTISQNGGSPQTVENCKRGPLGGKDLYFSTAELGLSPKDTIVRLWDSDLAGTVPNDGDVLVDPEGVAWNILTKTYHDQTGQHRCVCRLMR